MRASAPFPRSASRLRKVAALAGAIILTLQVPGAVGADHGGRPIGSLFACDRPGVAPPRCTSVADSRRHFIHFDASLTDGLAAALRDSMAEDYGATRLELVEQARLTTFTDVVVYSQDYGDNGAAGWVYCPPGAPSGTNPHGDRWCRQQELHFNLHPRFGAFFADRPSLDHIACHELGHTVGLRHWGNPPQTSGPEVGATCMNANTPDGPSELHAIDIDHINGYAYQRDPALRFPLVVSTVVPDVPPLRTWSGSLHATEVERHGSLEELVLSADAVVRGRVESVAAGRVFGDPAGAPLHYAAATLRVDQLIAGSLPAAHAERLVLEVPLFDGPGAIGALSAWGDGIYFLRNKASSAGAAGLSPERRVAEADYYRLVTFGGLILNGGGATVTDPEAPLVSGLHGVPFDEAVEELRALGR